MDCIEQIDEKKSNSSISSDDTNEPNAIGTNKQPRKQYCTFEGCNEYFFVNYRLERHIRKHTGEVCYLIKRKIELILILFLF